MSDPQEQQDSKPVQPDDPAKTPLDNLKGMLAQADQGAQQTPAVGSVAGAAQGPGVSPSQNIAKEVVVGVLNQVKGLSDEKLSPRQVDRLLRPIFALSASQKEAALKPAGGVSDSMRILSETLAKAKATPAPDVPAGQPSPEQHAP